MIKSFNSDDNLTSPKKIDEDIVNENSLRPLSFNDFIGQKNEIEKLKVFIKKSIKSKDEKSCLYF